MISDGNDLNLRQHEVLYVLANKPGTVIGGKWKDFDLEAENGYAPYQITVAKAMSLLNNEKLDEVIGKWDFHLA